MINMKTEHQNMDVCIHLRVCVYAHTHLTQRHMRAHTHTRTYM